MLWHMPGWDKNSENPVALCDTSAAAEGQLPHIFAGLI